MANFLRRACARRRVITCGVSFTSKFLETLIPDHVTTFQIDVMLEKSIELHNQAESASLFLLAKSVSASIEDGTNLTKARNGIDKPHIDPEC